MGMGAAPSGGGEKKAASDIQAQQKQIAEAMAAYNQRANPFFGLEQSRGEFGQSFFPDLQERIRNPTLSPTFKLYADEGLRNLREGFSATGSPSSGRAQIAGGRFLEGLAAHQLDRSDQMLLAGVNQRGQLPITQEPAYLGQITSLTPGLAQAHQADAIGGGGGAFSGGGAIQGASSGATAGSAFGPWGAAAGGLFGGLLGGFGGGK